MLRAPIQDGLWAKGQPKPINGKFCNKDLLISYSFSNAQILNAIHQLYLPACGIDLDVTWSKGLIYRGTELMPRLRFDIAPRPGFNTSAAADFHQLPLEDNSIESIMFDPPFFAAGGSPRENRIKIWIISQA